MFNTIHYYIYLMRTKITALKTRLLGGLKKKKKKKHPNTINIVSKYTPKQKTDGSAGFDLIANLSSNNLLFRAGETHLVPTGVSIEIPKGKVGLLFIRSGLSVESPLGLTNGVGVIDSDYRGEILVPLRNFSASKRHTLLNGDRIAQLVILDYFSPFLKHVSSLNDTIRSSGGFGSTGKN